MESDTQDCRLISILEIVGAHFVDVFYNHIYSSARTALAQGGRTRILVTDEYCRRVRAYVLGVKQDPRCYGDVVMGLHRYFQGYSTLSFADFVDRIVSQFVPEDYYKLMHASDKDESMSTVICDLVVGLGAYATGQDMLARVIDDRVAHPQVTIRMLQDHSITLMLAKRDEVHNQFLRKLGSGQLAYVARMAKFPNIDLSSV
jgi:hypothetical protein